MDSTIKCVNRIYELNSILRDSHILKLHNIYVLKLKSAIIPNFRIALERNNFLDKYNVSEVSISISPNIFGNRTIDLLENKLPSTIEICIFDENDKIIQNTDELGFPKGDNIKRFKDFNYVSLIDYLCRLAKGPYPIYI